MTELYYDMLARGLITVRMVSVIEAKFGRPVEALETGDFSLDLN